MLNADDAVRLTSDKIIEHYKGTGHIPASVSTYNRMMREQLLSLKEMQAFTLHMREKGFEINPELEIIWQSAIAPIETYLISLEKYLGANHSINRARKERDLSDNSRG